MATQASHPNPTRIDPKDLDTLDVSVDVSVLINQLFVLSLKAAGNAGEVDSDILSISAAFEQLTASIGEITSNARSVNAASRKVSGSVTEGQNVSAQALENMGRIIEMVSEAKRRNMELSQESEHIEQALARIQSISNQTNLLALNATIQAARAGKAGRAFAVVAGEVKQLSQETGSAAQEISTVLRGLTGSLRQSVSSMETVSEAVHEGETISRRVVEHMNTIDSLAQEALSSSEEIARALEQQGEAAVEVSRASSSIAETTQQSKAIAASNAELGRRASHRMEALIAKVSEKLGGSGYAVIKLAKSDHVVWKRKFHDLLFGSSNLEESDVVSHHNCRLGRWYDSEGESLAAGHPAFRELEAPHERVHAIGRVIFDRMRANDIDGALARLDDFEGASTEVLRALDRLDQHLARQR